MVYKTNFVLVVEGIGRSSAEGAKRRRYYEEEGEVQENEETSFSSKSQSYCVCFVSMVDFTETTFTINDPDKIRRYYSVFINTMAAIARNFDAKVIKNTGTSLVYFQKHLNELKPQHINYEGYQVEKNQAAPVGQEAREIKELRRKQQQETQQQQQKKGCLTTAANVTIMLVDDEPDILLTYKTYLTSAGYNVDAFTDPREALMRFVHADPNTYNLVLVDIRMPNLNGLQLYYRLKTKNPNIKILFVSAQEMVSILPGTGLDDVTRKPVDNDQFLSKVKTAR